MRDEVHEDESSVLSVDSSVLFLQYSCCQQRFSTPMLVIGNQPTKVNKQPMKVWQERNHKTEYRVVVTGRVGTRTFDDFTSAQHEAEEWMKQGKVAHIIANTSSQMYYEEEEE